MLKVKLEHVKKVWKAKAIRQKEEGKKQKQEKKKAVDFEISVSKPSARPSYEEPAPKPKP